MSASVSSDAGNEIITLDRRRGDRRDNSGDTPQNTAAPTKKFRRRQIDPTTCERDYREDEIEFMRAMDDYKRSSGRMFPTCSEVLEVVRSMGYVRLTVEQLEMLGDSVEPSPEPFAGEADDESEF